jgi:hypothetical protein
MNTIKYQINMKRYFEYIILSILLLLGLLVRLYKINSPVADWHSWRQADTASVSRSFFEKGINFLYPTYQDISSIQTGIFNPNGYRMVELPIFNFVHVELYCLFGGLSFDSWGRMVSVVCSLISAVILFFFG